MGGFRGMSMTPLTTCENCHIDYPAELVENYHMPHGYTLNLCGVCAMHIVPFPILLHRDNIEEQYQATLLELDRLAI